MTIVARGLGVDRSGDTGIVSTFGLGVYQQYIATTYALRVLPEYDYILVRPLAVHFDVDRGANRYVVPRLYTDLVVRPTNDSITTRPRMDKIDVRRTSNRVNIRPMQSDRRVKPLG